MTANIREKSDGITIECRVTPRSGKTAIRGIRNGALCMALAAPPVEGRANGALIEFLAKSLSLPRSNISIIRGEKGRDKVVFVTGITKEEFCGKFLVE